MILPARFALMVAFAVMAGKPAAAAAVQQPATVSEIGQFFDWRHGRAFWFASDNEAYASSPVARDEAHQHRRTARAQPAPGPRMGNRFRNRHRSRTFENYWLNERSRRLDVWRYRRLS